MKITKQLFQLLTCCLFMLIIAINKDQRVLNHSVDQLFVEQSAEQPDRWLADDGYTVISTANVAKDIFGFGGNIPLHIFLKDDKIVRVELQRHSETPEFIQSVIDQGLLSAWDGLTLHEVAQKRDIDAVSGATMSSMAIIETMARAAQLDDSGLIIATTGSRFKWDDIRFWCVLAVVLAAMIVPQFVKNKTYRKVQLALNVVVLGVWSGSFISLSSLVNLFANGLNIWLAIIPILLLIAAFVFPLFGKKSHYCTWVCPLGSCQELIGKELSYKLKMSPRTVKHLDYFREGLWIGIMGMLWLGVGFEVMNYELFSIFLFQQASWVVITLGVVFMLLSSVVQRPYCRFVCPTGSLLKYSQQTK